MPPKSKISEEIKNAIFNDYLNSSLSEKKIGLKYGISQGYVNDLCKLYNIPKRHKKYNIYEDYFETIDSEEKAYFLGFLTGDAHIFKNLKGFSLEIKNLDVEILEKLIFELKAEQKICFRTRFDKRTGKNSTNCYLVIYNKKICSDLIKHGVGPYKSKNCKIPLVPDNFLNSYIRGILDSDGFITICKNKDLRIGFLSSVNDFLIELQTILIEKCNVNKVAISIKPGCFSLNYGGNIQCRRIFEYIYGNKTGFFLKRKYELCKNHFDWWDSTELSKIHYSIQKHKYIEKYDPLNPRFMDIVHDYHNSLKQ